MKPLFDAATGLFFDAWLFLFCHPTHSVTRCHARGDVGVATSAPGTFLNLSAGITLHSVTTSSSMECLAR